MGAWVSQSNAELTGWRSGRRTTRSSRMSTTCATPRWRCGWRMSRRPLPGSWPTRSTLLPSSRERDNFHALCKDLERAEVKKWLAHILEILMAERAKDQRKNEFDKLEVLIKKHEELIPTVMKTQVMVDLYWKCYAYGDELKPHIEVLDGIMLASTRDIAPSCVENVDELIERQEKSLVQLETKRGVVKELIDKGKVILQNPDKPKFLEGHVQRIEVGWDDTKQKAQDRLTLLEQTKNAWVGYAENNETIASEFDKAEEEIKKVKKRFNLQSALDDLKKRQDLY